MAERRVYPSHPDLEFFNPEQFDMDLSTYSSVGSVGGRRPEMEADEQLLGKLGEIEGLVRRIDGQLAQRDKILSSGVHVPVQGKDPFPDIDNRGRKRREDEGDERSVKGILKPTSGQRRSVMIEPDPDEEESRRAREARERDRKEREEERQRERENRRKQSLARRQLEEEEERLRELAEEEDRKRRRAEEEQRKRDRDEQRRREREEEERRLKEEEDEERRAHEEAERERALREAQRQKEKEDRLLKLKQDKEREEEEMRRRQEEEEAEEARKLEDERRRRQEEEDERRRLAEEKLAQEKDEEKRRQLEEEEAERRRQEQLEEEERQRLADEEMRRLEAQHRRELEEAKARSLQRQKDEEERERREKEEEEERLRREREEEERHEKEREARRRASQLRRKKEEEDENMALKQVDSKNDDPIGTIVVPVITYARLKGLRRRSQDIGRQPQIEPEGVSALFDVADKVVNELRSHNPSNKYIKEISDDYKDLQETKKHTKKDDPKMVNLLAKFVDKLAKIEVQGKQFSSTNEESKFKDLEGRKSIQRILADHLLKDNPNRSVHSLKHFVIEFLKDFGNRMRVLTSPTAIQIAKETDSTLQMIHALEKTRPAEEFNSLLHLVEHSIKRNFSEDSPHTPTQDASGMMNPSILDFADFLRPVSTLSTISFHSLDDMVCEPANKINLFNMRHELIENGTVNNEKEKDNDLVIVNGLVKQWGRMEELLVNIGREVLPPRIYNERKSFVDEQGEPVHVKFVDFEKKEQKLKTVVGTSGFVDRYEFAPTFLPTSDRPLDQINESQDASQLNKHTIRPSMVTSEISPSHTNQPSYSPLDYRYQQAGTVINLTNTALDERDAAEDTLSELQSMNRKPSVTRAEKEKSIQKVNKVLEKIVEIEKEARPFRREFEDLEDEVQERKKLDGSKDEDHDKGLIKAWPKYLKAISKLRAAGQDLGEELANSKHMTDKALQESHEPAADVMHTPPLTEILDKVVELAYMLGPTHMEKVEEQTRWSNPHRRMSRDDKNKLIKEEESKIADMIHKVDALTEMMEEYRAQSKKRESMKYSSQPGTLAFAHQQLLRATEELLSACGDKAMADFPPKRDNLVDEMNTIEGRKVLALYDQLQTVADDAKKKIIEAGTGRRLGEQKKNEMEDKLRELYDELCNLRFGVNDSVERINVLPQESESKADESLHPKSHFTPTGNPLEDVINRLRSHIGKLKGHKDAENHPQLGKKINKTDDTLQTKPVPPMAVISDLAEVQRQAQGLKPEVSEALRDSLAADTEILSKLLQHRLDDKLRDAKKTLLDAGKTQGVDLEEGTSINPRRPKEPQKEEIRKHLDKLKTAKADAIEGGEER